MTAQPESSDRSTGAPPGDGSTGRDATLVRAVLDALPSPTTLIDGDGTLLLTNSAWDARAALLGADLLYGVGGNYYDMALAMKDDDTNHALVAELAALSRGEGTSVARDYALPHAGGVTWFHLQATRVGDAGHVVVTHTDVTARVRAERASTWRARHDPLTDLPNRAHLHELIDAELARPDRPAMTVLFLDVDGFKEVNDTLGHEVGDDLLRQLAARLTGRTRAEDTVGRLGGDEFVVLCRDCDEAGAETLARRFHSSFERPFDLAGRLVTLSASIGIATAAQGDTGVRSTDLVGDADLAMYAAKSAGRNRVRHFTADLRRAAQQSGLLAAELREAIGTDQLVLHYQPILQLPSGRCTGVEALVRWQHPERGLLPPGDFLPVAEEYGLMVPLTRWVLRTAATQTAAWKALGFHLVTGVNISASHFATGTLLDDVADALAGAGLAPEQLLIELTETSVAEDPARAAAQFAALRISGVEVAIDDFGAGFSSLAQLVNIPTGVLKIDRSLVASADGTSSQAAAAIAAVAGLAAALGMRSLAEGVETAEDLALATLLGCTFAQGFHIARPMPAEEIEGWIRARRCAARTAAEQLTAGTPVAVPV